jgi:hypothetical protein
VSIQEPTLASLIQTVKDVLLTVGFNAETLVVIISANFTQGHNFILKIDVASWMKYKPERVCLD